MLGESRGRSAIWSWTQTPSGGRLDFCSMELQSFLEVGWYLQYFFEARIHFGDAKLFFRADEA